MGYVLVSRTGDEESTLKIIKGKNIDEKKYFFVNSRTVVMEVEIRLGVCKNSPAEKDYFENGSCKNT